MGEQDNIPDWIKKQKRETEEQKHKAEEERQRQLEASALIHDKGPEFWQQLVDRIGINVGALKELELDGEEIVGTMSHGNDGAERNCHIQVNRVSVRFGPELSQMNLWYRPGGNRIRRWYQNRDAGDIGLVSQGSEVRAVVDRSGPFTAHRLADSLVEWMAEQVKAQNTIRI